MKNLLEIVAALLAVSAVVWSYLKLFAFLDECSERWLGRSFLRKKSRMEIQTLFHGRTKDEDQL